MHGTNKSGGLTWDQTNNIITIKEMAEAIEHKLGLPKQKSTKIAEFILDVFGYETRIIDNILKPDERQIFYMLEAEGLMTTERETNRLYDGREWLTHYWELRRNMILHYTHNQSTRVIKKITEPTMRKKTQSIYSSVSEDMWLTRKIHNRKTVG